MNWLHPLMLDALAWFALVAVWLVAAFFVRRTKWSEGLWQRLQYSIPMTLGFFLIFHDRRYSIVHGRVYRSQIVPWVGCAMTYLGIAGAIWARVVLGRYWSGTITLKQEHKLIRSGPYRFVRHPLYTGFLTAALGSAITAATGDAILGFVLILLACLIKIWREESLLRQEFGTDYDQFKRDVPAALLPFVF